MDYYTPLKVLHYQFTTFIHDPFFKESINLKASIIIPHYNQHEDLELCITTLLNQTVPREDYEIILIDNGSTKKVKSSIQEGVDVFKEYTNVLDPYNCRNVGIDLAKGEIIAFLDVKCRPKSSWLKEGLNYFSYHQGLDILPGRFNVQFDSLDNYQVYYSLNHLNHKKAVHEKSGLLTGNLFVRKSSFDKVGLFPENQRSGGDIVWTQKALEAGMKIKYGGNAIVHYPAKEKEQVLHSAIRDGKGAYTTYKLIGKGFGFHLKMLIYHLLPDRPERIYARIAYSSNKDLYEKKFTALWWITWKVNLYFMFGYLKGLFN